MCRPRCPRWSRPANRDSPSRTRFPLLLGRVSGHEARRRDRARVDQGVHGAGLVELDSHEGAEGKAGAVDAQLVPRRLVTDGLADGAKTNGWRHSGSRTRPAASPTSNDAPRTPTTQIPKRWAEQRPGPGCSPRPSRSARCDNARTPPAGTPPPAPDRAGHPSRPPEVVRSHPRTGGARASRSSSSPAASARPAWASQRR